MAINPKFLSAVSTHSENSNYGSVQAKGACSVVIDSVKNGVEVNVENVDSAKNLNSETTEIQYN